MASTGPRRRAVIITAIPVEFAAVRRHLTGLRIERHPQGSLYEIGTFDDWDVLIAEIGAGNEQAAFEAERAVGHFRPELAMFVGVAGGVKDVALGDVVVANGVYGYESGKDAKTFRPRPRVGNSNYELVQTARYVARSNDWHARIHPPPRRPPKVLIGRLASGNKVMANSRSTLARLLRDSYGDTLAVEMEGIGFMTALQANNMVRAIDVRGISDLLDNKKKSDSAGWQKRAAANAAAFAFALLALSPPRDAGEGASDRLDDLRKDIDALRENRAPAAAAEARQPIPRALPALDGVFVDRVEQQKLLKHLLAKQNAPFICVIGPGGFGKSELVNNLLQEIAPNSAIAQPGLAGIAYVRCVRGETSLDHIVELLGVIAGARSRIRVIFEGELPLREKVGHLLAGIAPAGGVWLILDNFEELLDGNDNVEDAALSVFFEEVIGTSHVLRVIATSRNQPRVHGRSPEKVELTEGLPETEAVEYLRAEGAEIGLAEVDDALLREVTRRVYGIPKALDTVIGFLTDNYPTMTIRKLLEDSSVFSMFESYDDASGLRSLIDRQIAQQPPEVFHVLAAVSIFTAPAALEDISAVAGCACDSTVARLVRNKLVSFRNETFDVHPIVRELVCRRLDPDGRRAMHRRAAAHWQNTGKPIGAARSLDDMTPHLAAFHHLVEAGDHATASALLNQLTPRLSKWGHYAVVLDLRSRLDPEKLPPTDRFLNLFHRSMPLIRLGRIDESLAMLEEARAVARELGSGEYEEWCVNNMAIAELNRQNVSRAIDLYKEALEMSRQLGRSVMVPLGNLGEALLRVGVVDESLTLIQEALRIARATPGKERQQGSYVAELANIYFRQGKYV